MIRSRGFAAGLAAAAALSAATPSFAGYEQASAPLKTPWGEKVTPENAWREYPRPQMVRGNWENLNGLWQYAIVTNELHGTPDRWDGEILVPFPLESALSGVGRLLGPTDLLWYRRTFKSQGRGAFAASGERLILHFEQSDFRTMVFVNGVEAGLPHEGGSLPFSFDVTELVKDGENELTVVVWDPTETFVQSCGKQRIKTHPCCYTRSSGICGTVWLERVPEAHIADWRVATDADKGEVTFVFNVAGGSQFIATEGEITITDAMNCVPTARFRPDEPVTVKLPAPVALWSPESPALYDFTARYGKDEIKGYFAVRKVEVKKDSSGVLRVHLNGSPRFLAGVLDQGWWPDGLLTPPSVDAMAFELETIKSLGMNTVRKHMKVEPRLYYHLCDKMGVLVMQDMLWARTNPLQRYGMYREEFKALIDHLRNVPSIIAWCPYNEKGGQPGAFLTHATLAWAERYDPTRLIDGPSGWNDFEGGEARPRSRKDSQITRHLPPEREEPGHLVDFHVYQQKPPMPALNERRASFIGEFGGIGCRIDGHVWTDDTYAYGGTGKVTDRALMQQRLVDLLDHIATLAAKGLSGCIYTQTTDVEGEVNGLLTYDRRVVKFDAKAIRAAFERIIRNGTP